VRIVLAVAVLFLTACSKNPNIIEPSPLPEFEAEYRVEQVWRKNAGAGVDDSRMQLRPAATGRSVFAADVEGHVSAFARGKGHRRWRRDTGYRIAGGVEAAYGMVLFGTRDGEVVALSADNGDERWRARVGSEVLAAPATDGNQVVVQTLDGQVVSLNADTGEQRWSFNVSVPVLTLRGTSAPVIANNRVLTAFASGQLVALQSDGGVQAWQHQVAEPTGRSELDRLVDVDANLVVSDGAVFAATFQGKLAVVDLNNGRPYWKRDMSTHVAMDLGSSALFVADDESRVHAIQQRTGDTLWRQDKLRGRRLAGVVVHQQLPVTGDQDGYLHWLDASSGQPVARRRHGGDGFAGAPVVRDAVLYVLGRDGALAAYRLEPKDAS
jgi:outer membrane protein assembly factor BamB